MAAVSPLCKVFLSFPVKGDKAQEQKQGLPLLKSLKDADRNINVYSKVIHRNRNRVYVSPFLISLLQFLPLSLSKWSEARGNG